MTPLVSIVVPCFNAAPWLAAAIESALAQTWSEQEIIVVDDGSRDDSLAIARRYEARGVRVATQPNRGAAAARNHGLRLARGQFIQFLDADDLLAPDKTARQIQRLQTARPRTIASAEWARFTNEPAEACFTAEPNWRDLSGLEFLTLHYEAGWMMQPAAWLCPRVLLDEIGPWDESLSLNDDGEYFARAMLASDGIVFCTGARVYYRSSVAGSLSRRKDPVALRSLWRVNELNCGRMLAAAHHSPRARAAAANGWQRLAFEAYPALPALARAAEQRCGELGGTSQPMPAGRNFQRIAHVIGWRAAKRLRDATLALRR